MNLNIASVIENLKDNYRQIDGAIKVVEKVSSQSKLLALNSAIEAARAGEHGRGFSVVAAEVGAMADRTLEASAKNQELLASIRKHIDELVAIRTVDLAYDTIDKIDRNLFERNCDVQAWAAFEAIVEAVSNPSAETIAKANAFLDNVVKIYEVYYDIFAMARDGTIIASGGKDRSLLGRSVAESQWFSDVVKTGGVVVTDMHQSSLVNEHVLNYSCPIIGQNGTLMGVISTRFNWNYIYEIIDSVKLSKTAELSLIAEDGRVIASNVRSRVLRKSFANSEAYRQIRRGQGIGYLVRDGKICAYCLTKGYNAYKGLGWSVLIEDSLENS